MHSIARRRSGRVLQTTFRRLSWMNRGIDRLKARHATLLARITLIPDEHVAHPSGGHRTLSRTEADRDTLAARVDQERSQNSRKHDRLPRWFRHLPRVVLVFDFLLLLYFLSGITDVNWSNPGSPQLAFAVGLAAMITLVSYGCFAFAGDRLRAHKGHAGRIPFGSLDWLTWVIVIACTVGIVVLGAAHVLPDVVRGPARPRQRGHDHRDQRGGGRHRGKHPGERHGHLGARQGRIGGDRPARRVRRRAPAPAAAARPNAAPCRPARTPHRGPRP